MDFEGEYTIRTASNQQTYEPNTVYPDAVLNIARESASVFQLKRKWEKTPPMLNLTPDFQRGQLGIADLFRSPCVRLGNESADGFPQPPCL